MNVTMCAWCFGLVSVTSYTIDIAFLVFGSVFALDPLLPSFRNRGCQWGEDARGLVGRGGAGRGGNALAPAFHTVFLT